MKVRDLRRHALISAANIGTPRSTSYRTFGHPAGTTVVYATRTNVDQAPTLIFGANSASTPPDLGGLWLFLMPCDHGLHLHLSYS